MAVLSVIAQKGGAGKTTLSRNLAVVAASHGKRVLCLDLDPQQSLRAWWQAREADDIAMFDEDPAPFDLPRIVASTKDDFDLIIIDTPPAAPVWIGEVLSVSDLALVPVRPSPDDMRAVGATIGALNKTRTPFAFIMSQTPRARITEEAAREIAKWGRVAPVNIYQRVSYAETGATGLGVVEVSDAKAQTEINDLWTYVEEIL